MYGVLNLDKIKNELHSLLVNCEMQGRTANSEALCETMNWALVLSLHSANAQ